MITPQEGLIQASADFNRVNVKVFRDSLLMYVFFSRFNFTNTPSLTTKSFSYPIHSFPTYSSLFNVSFCKFSQYISPALVTACFSVEGSAINIAIPSISRISKDTKSISENFHSNKQRELILLPSLLSFYEDVP